MAKEEKKAKFTVVARQPSRWRAGQQFGAEPRDVDLTEEQAAAIAADPQLVITPVAEAAAEARGKSKGESKD